MKASGTEFWQSPNTGATNISGFSGLPAGYRWYDGTFEGIRTNGRWWDSTGYAPTTTLNFARHHDESIIHELDLGIVGQMNPELIRYELKKVKSFSKNAGAQHLLILVFSDRDKSPIDIFYIFRQV